MAADAVPSPDATVTTPPVFTVLRPASTSTSPPLPSCRPRQRDESPATVRRRARAELQRARRLLVMCPTRK